MLPFEQIFIILVAVHLLTIALFYIVKRSKISSKFKSSSDHPANVGNIATQLGGVVIVPVTIFASLIIFFTFKNIPLNTQLVFCAHFTLLFLIGMYDDFQPIPAWVRLTIHIANAISITIIIFQITGYSGLAEVVSILGIIIPSIFMVLAISWMINAVNFIDGMDLFLFVNIVPGCLLFSLLGFSASELSYISLVFFVFSSALIGFAWFNKPNATIYMGDSGTLCIGFLLSACAVFILARYGSIAGFIPFTYILVDTTFTLIDRVMKAENVLGSHNHHAYQIARRNGKTENTIRLNCFTINILNTGMAYVCFVFEHSLLWQFCMASMALSLSTFTFFFFRKSKITRV